MQNTMKKIFFILLTSVMIFACDGGNGAAGQIGGDDDPTEGTQTPPTGNEGTGSGIAPGNLNANIGGEKYAHRIEIPRLNDDYYFLTRTTTVDGEENITYSISFNAERHHSRWVAFTFNKSNRAKNVGRSKYFVADPDIIGQYTMTSAQINDNDFQRGHLVASYDRVYSRAANEQTFYLSNISPMYGGFNTGLWLDLENVINDKNGGWGCDNTFSDTLYVVKGGTIATGQYTSKGTCPTVPKHYFMALLRLKNNRYSSIAFLMPHKESLPGKYKDYIITVDELEEFTGIDFFCNLNDKLENAVENFVDNNIWNIK